jgi:hypothetical protein
MRLAWIFALAACGSSPPPPAASTPPPAATPPQAAAPAASSLAGEARCRQAMQHIDQLSIPPNLDPETAQSRLQAIEQAREAGILRGDQTPDCIERWTNAVVDCVLAGSDKATANACIPAEASR